MNVGDRYTIERFNEETGGLTLLTFEVVSVEDGVVQSIQVSN